MGASRVSREVKKGVPENSLRRFCDLKLTRRIRVTAFLLDWNQFLLTPFSILFSMAVLIGGEAKLANQTIWSYYANIFVFIWMEKFYFQRISKDIDLKRAWHEQIDGLGSPP